MRALLIAALLSTSTLAHAAEGDLSKASERLERARATLKDAIARIEKKNPSDSDFDAASAALPPLKAALDAGNDLEAQDLGYAKAALEGRKELRAGRERIERRRVEVKSEGVKDSVEQSLATVEGELSRLDGKSPPAQFQKTQTAIDAAAKALEAARALAKSDAELTKWVAGMAAKIEEHQRTLDGHQLGGLVEKQKSKVEAGLRVLADTMQPLAAELVAEAQFAEAESAVRAMNKILEDGNKLEGRNKEYGALAAKAGKEVAAAKQKIDEKKTELASAKQKEELDGIAQSVDQAVKAMNASDDGELLTEAEKAASILKRMLESAEALPGKSPKFAQYLGTVRKSLRAAEESIAKKRIPLQKSRVEEARAELNKALAELRKNQADETAFAAAEASIETVDRALLEGSEFEKDPKYGAYARELRAKLREHRTWLGTRRGDMALVQQRNELKSAREAVSGAMKRINGQNPADSDFDEANTALTVFEKTIEAARKIKGKDAPFVQYLSDLKKSVPVTRKAIEERRLTVTVQGQRAKVEAELASLSDALAAIDGPAPNQAMFNACADAAQRVQAAIDAGAALEKKQARYGTYAGQARKVLQRANQRIEARKLELNVAAGSGQLEKLMLEASSAVDEAKGETADKAQIDKSKAAIAAMREALTKNASLEKQDKSYAKFATAAKEQLAGLSGELDLAGHMIAFRKGPVAAHAEGLAAAQTGANASGLEQQRDAFKQAVERFKACQHDSADMLGDHPKLATMDVNVGKTRAPAKTLIALCDEQVEAAQEKLGHVQAILDVYDGPAKSIEAAQALAAKGSLAEALAQFESCLEKGKLIQHKHPKLAEQKFDVGAKQLTLSSIVSQCQESAKSTREVLKKKN